MKWLVYKEIFNPVTPFPAPFQVSSALQLRPNTRSGVIGRVRTRFPVA